MLRKGNILDGAESRTIEASQRIDVGTEPASGSMLDWVLINAKGKNGNLETRGPLGKHGGDRSVGGLIREPPHGGYANVNGGGCKVFLFEKEPVTKDNRPVEGQTRFGTVQPMNFVDGMTVGFLRTGRRERVKNRILRLLQIR